ncbi:MAG: AtpZ/AtpI family protein [Pseudomonadota bacterium]
MTGETRGTSPEGSFEERLKRARARREARETAARAKAGAAMGIGFRLSLELVVAVLVGSALGFGLDRWLGTGPWLLVVFFILGAAAGIRSMLRAVEEMKMSPPPDEAEADGKNEPGS